MDDRKLCELAAIHIFGWKWIDDRRTGQPILVDSDTEWVETFDLGTRVDPLQSLPDYLTGDGMLRVIERMTTGLGYRFWLEWLPSRGISCNMKTQEVRHTPLWSASFYTTTLKDAIERGVSDFRKGRGCADTAPRVVLLAALRAMGVDIDAIRDS